MIISSKHLTALTTALLLAAAQAAFAISGKPWSDIMEDARAPERSPLDRLQSSRNALAEARKFGEDDPRYSESLRMVSSCLFELGRFKEAEPFVVAERKILGKMGDDYPGLDYDFYWLGVLAEQRGDLQEGLRLQKAALDLALRFPKPGTPSPAQIYTHLAALSYAFGDTNAAEEHVSMSAKYVFRSLKRVDLTYAHETVSDAVALINYIEEAKNVLGKRVNSDPKFAQNDDVNKLMDGYYFTSKRLGKYLFEECASVNPPSSLPYVDTLDQYAWALGVANDFPRARFRAQNALDLATKYFPNDYKRLYSINFHVAYPLIQARDDRAEQFLKASVKCAELANCDMNWGVVYLANFYMFRGNDAAAIAAYEHAIATGIPIPQQADHLAANMVELCMKLGDRLITEGKPKEAADVYRRALVPSQRLKSRKEYSAVMYSLGHALFLCNKDAEAANYLYAFVEAKSSRKAFKDADLLRRGLQDLVDLYSKVAPEKASHFKQRINDRYYDTARNEMIQRIKTRGPTSPTRQADHMELGEIEEQHAVTMLQARDWNSAKRDFNYALTDYKMALGKGYKYASVLTQLAELEINLHQYEAAAKHLEFALLAARIYSRHNLWVDPLDRLMAALKRLKSESHSSPPWLVLYLSPEYISKSTPIITAGNTNGIRYLNRRAADDWAQLTSLDVRTFGPRSIFARSDYRWDAEYAYMFNDYTQEEKAAQEFLKCPPGFDEDYQNPHVRSFLIHAYLGQGKYREAEKTARDLLTLGVKLQGVERVRCIHLLAASLLYQDKKDEAQQLYVSIRKGCQRDSTICGIGKDVAKHFEILRPKLAADDERLCKEELAIYEKVSGRQTAGKAYMLNELASAYAAQNKHEDACKTFKQAITILQDEEPANIEVQNKWMTTYAASLRAAGNTKDADKVLAEVTEQAKLATSFK